MSLRSIIQMRKKKRDFSDDEKNLKTNDRIFFFVFLLTQSAKNCEEENDENGKQLGVMANAITIIT